MERQRNPWPGNARADFNEAAMINNSSKTLKRPSKRHGGRKLQRSSTRSPKANGVSETVLSKSQTRRKPANNSAHNPGEEKVDALMQQALALKNAKDFRGAANILVRITKAYPRCAAAFGLLGLICYCELGQVKQAVGAFQQASRLSPTSETASLGLFHALWKAGYRKRAIAEMERFQAISNSADYAEIEAELRGAGVRS